MGNGNPCQTTGFIVNAALSFDGDDYTAAEIDGLTCGLAVTLRRRGVQHGDRVALMSSNRPEFVIALKALWGIGAAVVLISPAWKPAEVHHALTLTQPRHAVGDSAVLAETMPMLSLDEAITPARIPIATPSPESDAVFVFSSGTTGLPKAVRHSHHALGAAARQWRAALGLNARDRMQILTPPSHILGLLNIITALETGCWIRLHRRFDLDAMLHTIARDRITVEMMVAPIALAWAACPDLERFDLTSLRYVVWGATPYASSVAESISRRTSVRWLTAYGASELPVITCNPLHDVRLDTVGLPVQGVELRIVSPQTGAVLPTGEQGEIQARSESMMAGYLPADVSGTFADGWYRTGDIGQLDALGYLTITDRLKEMIKVRGFQVAPAEIESVLHSHPAVADCAAFGVADAADGEAVVVAVERSADVDPAELIALVGDRLSSYKRPRSVIFVDKLPRLASGKLVRRELKSAYERSLIDRGTTEATG